MIGFRINKNSNFGSLTFFYEQIKLRCRQSDLS